MTTLTYSDANATSVTATYAYEDRRIRRGSTPDKTKDLGFASVTKVNASGVRTVTTFRQDAPYEGLVGSVCVFGPDGKRYATTTYEYGERDVGGALSGVWSVQCVGRTDTVYDGAASGYTTRETYSYDAYGNPTDVVRHGDESANDDERTISTWAINESTWVMAVSSEVVQRVLRGGSGLSVEAESRYYYDGSLSLARSGQGFLRALKRSTGRRTW